VLELIDKFNSTSVLLEGIEGLNLDCFIWIVSALRGSVLEV